MRLTQRAGVGRASCDPMPRAGAPAQGEHGLQTTLRGVSPIWAPPEMFNDRAEAMTERADVYSLGIVFFEVATRQLPFQEVRQRELPRAKFEGVLPQLPNSLEEDFGELVCACCAHRPSARPSMGGIAARLAEFARARGVDLAAVAMPMWEGATEGEAEQEAAPRRRRKRARGPLAPPPPSSLCASLASPPLSL